LLIALALIFARIFGFIFTKFKLPAVIGEILAGFILGALSFSIFKGEIISFFGMNIAIPNLNFLSVEFDFLAKIGILFLLFISGLSTNLNQLKTMGKTSTFVAIGGVIAPLILGIIAGIFLGFNTMDSLTIGLVLIATSVGVTVRTLMDMNLLDSKSGTTILGGAVIDDVLGIIILAFVIGADSYLLIGFKIILFFFIFLYLGLKVIDRVMDLGEKIILPKAFLSISIALFLLLSYFADLSGISGIIGAFIAGILIGHSIKSRKIIDDVNSLGYGFFVPLFFIWIGVKLFMGIYQDASIIISIGVIAFVIILMGMIGKIVGCGLGAKLAGMSNKESIQIGVGMIPRMELALIIVSAAISHNLLSSTLIENQLLASTVLLTVVTTMITPFLIKIVYK
jgi:Kef-type K+ transport system membrane component KefB